MEDELLWFGQRIKELRRLKNMSQEDLAYRAGLDRTYISSIERGKRNVSLKNIIKVADALGVKPSTILEGFDGHN